MRNETGDEEETDKEETDKEEDRGGPVAVFVNGALSKILPTAPPVQPPPLPATTEPPPGTQEHDQWSGSEVKEIKKTLNEHGQRLYRLERWQWALGAVITPLVTIGVPWLLAKLPALLARLFPLFVLVLVLGGTSACSLTGAQRAALAVDLAGDALEGARPILAERCSEEIEKIEASLQRGEIVKDLDEKVKSIDEFCDPAAVAFHSLHLAWSELKVILQGVLLGSEPESILAQAIMVALRAIPPLSEAIAKLVKEP